MIRRLLLVALALASSPASPPPPSCKPTAPIDIDARIDGDPGALFSVIAKARSRLGGPVDLEILLPEGITAHAGRNKVSGRACETRMELSARDRSRREILVKASFTQGSATVIRVIPLVIFDRPLPAPKVPVRTNSRGERILEYSP